jgi:ubiquinone/menaquinone biosynthesis C-methylase UbiE
MQTKQAYNQWSQTYDRVENKTRDLEATAIRSILNDIGADRILEIGCGTGKNTSWLLAKCTHLTAIDFSEEMLAAARKKIKSDKIHFVQADITKDWNFGTFELVTCSLVLEHIENLQYVFNEAAKSLNIGGYFYIGELHPFKQLQGSRAKFESEGETRYLEYFIHHISDYINFARKSGFSCFDLQEWFDDGNKTDIPRLVSYLFRREH